MITFLSMNMEILHLPDVMAMKFGVVLLEKAWAKLNGSYDIIWGGHGSVTFRDITGAPAYEYEINFAHLWETI